MVFDPELQAMSNVYETLKDLNNVQRQRILKWVKDRLETEPTAVITEYVTPVISHVEEAEEIKTEPVAKSADITEDTPPSTASKPAGPKSLKDYETALELFSDSNVKKATTRVLLMAAYLQERHNFKEISSYDINFRLKRISFGVTNISSLINAIMTRVPKLLIHEGAEEHTKQARRKFSVTPAGIAVAKSYMKG